MCVPLTNCIFFTTFETNFYWKSHFATLFPHTSRNKSKTSFSLVSLHPPCKGQVPNTARFHMALHPTWLAFQFWINSCPKQAKTKGWDKPKGDSARSSKTKERKKTDPCFTPSLDLYRLPVCFPLTHMHPNNAFLFMFGTINWGNWIGSLWPLIWFMEKMHIYLLPIYEWITHSNANIGISGIKMC